MFLIKFSSLSYKNPLTYILVILVKPRVVIHNSNERLVEAVTILSLAGW